MTTNLTKFNTQMEDLIIQLMNIISKNGDIKIFYEKFKIIKSTNPKKIVEGFLKYIYPYKNQIMNKDELFFLDDKVEDKIKNYNELEKDTGCDNEYVLTKALNLKYLWLNDLNNENKEVIWKYFQVLIILCERYVIALQNNL